MKKGTRFKLNNVFRIFLAGSIVNSKSSNLNNIKNIFPYANLKEKYILNQSEKISVLKHYKNFVLIEPWYSILLSNSNETTQHFDPNYELDWR